jgi:hypothetical protein
MVKPVIVLLLAMATSTLALPTRFMDTLQVIFGSAVTPLDLPKPEIGWADPRLNGGRFLDVSSIVHQVQDSCYIDLQFTTPRYGEPLNVIISNQSDPFILTDAGFRLYYK